AATRDRPIRDPYTLALRTSRNDLYCSVSSGSKSMESWNLDAALKMFVQQFPGQGWAELSSCPCRKTSGLSRLPVTRPPVTCSKAAQYSTSRSVSLRSQYEIVC